MWLGVLFGVLPDLLSFGILMLINSVNGNFRRGPPPLDSLPQWLSSAYNMTHSFVVFAFAFFLIYIITKKWYWPLTGWAIHILIDIPTHSTRYFATPFLWPVSGYKFNGISWGTGWFMILNYAALAIIFTIISISNKKRKKARTA